MGEPLEHHGIARRGILQSLQTCNKEISLPMEKEEAYDQHIIKIR